MNSRRKRAVSGIILLILFLCAGTVCLLGMGDIKRTTPKGVEIYNPGGVGMTMGQVFELKSYKHMSTLYTLAVSTGEDGTVTAENRAPERAHISYASPSDSGLMPFEFTCGNWFLNWTDHSSPMAVIPESLALSLFGTDCPQGVAVNVNNVRYMVCGVYRENSGVIADLTSDGLPRIYLSDPDMDIRPVTALYLSDKKERDADALRQWVNGMSLVRLNGSVTDYRTQVTLVKNLLTLELFICGLFLAVLLFVTGAEFLIRAHECSSGRIWRTIAGVAVIAATFACLTFAMRWLYLPSVYLPRNSIFDFSHYCKIFISYVQSVNLKGSAAVFDRYFAARSCCTLAVGFAGCWLFFFGALTIRRALKTR